MCTGILLCIIKCLVPNNRKDDSNEKENKSCHKNRSVIMLFGVAKLTCPVIGIFLVLFSAHRDKGERHISQNESDTDECTFAADIHHAGKQGHQDTGDEESVRQDLDIYRQTMCEKPL